MNQVRILCTPSQSGRIRQVSLQKRPCVNIHFTGDRRGRLFSDGVQQAQEPLFHYFVVIGSSSVSCDRAVRPIRAVPGRIAGRRTRWRRFIRAIDHAGYDDRSTGWHHLSRVRATQRLSFEIPHLSGHAIVDPALKLFKSFDRPGATDSEKVEPQIACAAFNPVCETPAVGSGERAAIRPG